MKKFSAYLENNFYLQSVYNFLEFTLFEYTYIAIDMYSKFSLNVIFDWEFICEATLIAIKFANKRISQRGGCLID